MKHIKLRKVKEIIVAYQPGKQDFAARDAISSMTLVPWQLMKDEELLANDHITMDVRILIDRK